MIITDYLQTEFFQQNHVIFCENLDSDSQHLQQLIVDIVKYVKASDL